MVNRILILLIVLGVFLALDIYCYGTVKTAFNFSSERIQKIALYSYWSVSFLTLLLIVGFMFYNPENIDSIVRNFLVTLVFTNLITKLLMTIFLFIEDLTRGVKWAISKISFISQGIEQPINIARADFLAQSTLVLAAVPTLAVGYGILTGAHDYRVKQVKLSLENLPKSFEGLKIVQISDVHAGSFFNKRAVIGGIETIMNQKADLVFFTGDLVNNEAREMNNWVNVFDKIKAPLGVYSTLGNHDYGDYKSWDSKIEKDKNLEDLKRVHSNMGWRLLMNENKILSEGADKIAIMGIENWGKGNRWPKYGQMPNAYIGCEEASVKLLLSHDPSHWDAQVRTQYQDIDVSFAGHTHGFQFGIEVGSFRWSPVQYAYKQWSGLYQEQKQMLYVNQGFGYIGFPGRVGMPPEITVFTLTQRNG